MSETAEQIQPPLLKTKLHRPLVPRDFVHRPRLHERMDQGIVARVASCLDGKKLEPALLSELSLLRGVLQFWEGKSESSWRSLEKALAQVSDQQGSVRAEAEFYLAMVLQMVGEGEKAIETLDEKIRAANSPSDMLASRLMGAQLHIHLLSAEFEMVLQVARRLRTLMKGRNAYVAAWIH